MSFDRVERPARRAIAEPPGDAAPGRERFAMPDSGRILCHARATQVAVATTPDCERADPPVVSSPCADHAPPPRRSERRLTFRRSPHDFDDEPVPVGILAGAPLYLVGPFAAAAIVLAFWRDWTCETTGLHPICRAPTRAWRSACASSSPAGRSSRLPRTPRSAGHWQLGTL